MSSAQDIIAAANREIVKEIAVGVLGNTDAEVEHAIDEINARGDKPLPDETCGGRLVEELVQAIVSAANQAANREIIKQVTALLMGGRVDFIERAIDEFAVSDKTPPPGEFGKLIRQLWCESS